MNRDTFNTGKVRIGLLYQPKLPPVQGDAVLVQKALLEASACSKHWGTCMHDERCKDTACQGHPNYQAPPSAPSSRVELFPKTPAGRARAISAWLGVAGICTFAAIEIARRLP